ncbi:uncharacterized membrane protein YcgQ (UPF0703/DUF1980 family) [Aequitasia blattaphilus]|uniref:DUF3221 domain-containing protein n=1 Tax=Aequitasia blattaphilus TaxID=2949332 RepID=A0ABT1EBZ0_9FIRM|nr:hypothetical protein [Aequitasia blattaphilus]MCP1102351.1 hypothetical protein [Aequitasia blattaphilus]MCR8614991.1 hypothetical protein [Aequitasia blattaphilus]
MKKTLIILCFLFLFSLIGCKKAEEPTDIEKEISTDSSENEVIDLTVLNSTMVYAEVFNIVSNPDDYLGKTIVMEGLHYTNHIDETNTTYHFVVIQDATSCCQQGLEFIYNDDTSYPQDGTPVEVSGTFEKYTEGEDVFYRVHAM